MKLTLFQKLRSYCCPLLIRRESSPINPVLDLLYYQGRWQLATADALYPDGVRYRPLVAAFKSLGAMLPQLKNVLVLGTGLGSAVEILHRKGIRPAFTLVELDRQVLHLALELMPPGRAADIRPVCADAEAFIEEDRGRYDLIIVDIFNGREVPGFVLRPAFLQACKARLGPGGWVVLNYMVNDRLQEGKAKAALEAAFGTVREIALGINRVYLARA